MTAVEWLISKQKHNKFFDVETIEIAKEKEKQQIIDFAIGFAEWLQYNYYADETIKQLLEIYKKEKGL